MSVVESTVTQAAFPLSSLWQQCVDEGSQTQTCRDRGGERDRGREKQGRGGRVGKTRGLDVEGENYSLSEQNENIH